MCSGVRGEKVVAEKGEKRSLVLVVKGAGKGRGESQLVVDGVVIVVNGGVDSAEQAPKDCSMNGGSRVTVDVVAGPNGAVTGRMAAGAASCPIFSESTGSIIRPLFPLRVAKNGRQLFLSLKSGLGVGAAALALFSWSCPVSGGRTDTGMLFSSPPRPWLQT